MSVKSHFLLFWIYSGLSLKIFQQHCFECFHDEEYTIYVCGTFHVTTAYMKAALAAKTLFSKMTSAKMYGLKSLKIFFS